MIDSLSRASKDSPASGTFGAWPAVLVLGLVTAIRLAYLPFHPFSLYPDEAQYWSWSLDPAWGYFSKPPVVAWLIAATTSVCGSGVACIKLSVPLLHFATGLLVYATGARLFDRRIAFLSALAYITLPGVTFSSTIISTDPPLMTFWAVGLYALARLATGVRTRWLWWGVLGIAVGLGTLSKYSMVFFVIALALWLVLDREARARLLPAPGDRLGLAAAAVIGGLIYLPNFLWNMGTGFVTYAHTESNANFGATSIHPNHLGDFMLSQFGVFGPILFAVLLLLLVRVGRWRADWRERMLAPFVLSMFLPILALSLVTRANANWVAPIYVAASIWVTAALVKWGRRDVAIGSIMLHTTVFALLLIGLVLYRGPGNYAGFQLPRGLDLYKHHEGWRVIGDKVSALRRQFPGTPLLVADRMLMAALLYNVHPMPARAVEWAPDGRVTDHYMLTRPLPPAPGGDYLFVARHPEPARVLDHFRNARLVAEIAVPVGSGDTRRVWVFYARGFLGYKAARPGA